MPKLHFTNGEFDGTVYGLTLEKTSVGRSHTNTVVICDRFVSAKHCDILVNGSEVIVRDLGSRNGTFVNGRRLQNQQCGVKSGHIIAFGSVQARLRSSWTRTKPTCLPRAQFTATRAPCAMGAALNERVSTRTRR